MRKLSAEEANYWKTSKSAPDAWMGKAIRQIKQLGGVVLAEGFGSEPATGSCSLHVGL